MSALEKIIEAAEELLTALPSEIATEERAKLERAILDYRQQNSQD